MFKEGLDRCSQDSEERLKPEAKPSLVTGGDKPAFLLCRLPGAGAMAWSKQVVSLEDQLPWDPWNLGPRYQRVKEEVGSLKSALAVHPNLSAAMPKAVLSFLEERHGDI